MRRVVGVVLAGLGAFLLVLALMARFVLPGLVIKFPVDEYTITRLSGTNVSYLSSETGKEVTGATVRVVATTQGDVTAGTSSTAFWNTDTGVFDITNGGNGTAISYTTEYVGFDRRSGLLVQNAADKIDGQPVTVSGQGYVWPLGVKKQSYQYFDTTLRKAEPVTYGGTTTVDGLKVYIFTEHVTNQQFGTVKVPGSLVNQSAASVTLPEVLTATNTYYVDPNNGSPVKVNQVQSETLQDPSTGAAALTLFDATLTSTSATVAAAVHTAKTADTEIVWVQDIGPLIALLLGIVLIVLGVILVATAEQEEYEYEDDDTAVAAGA